MTEKCGVALDLHGDVVSKMGRQGRLCPDAIRMHNAGIYVDKQFWNFFFLVNLFELEL